MRAGAFGVLALAACGRHASPPPAVHQDPHVPATVDEAVAAGSAADAAWRCTLEPFATSSPVPEASGAAWWPIDGKPALVVVSDSGDHGAYAIVDADTGTTLEQGALPLGEGASDDLEGLASHGDRLYGLTSSGWMRTWRREGAGWALVDGPYPIGPVDPKLGGHGNRPPEGDGMVCDGPKLNCGRNYEGLALAAHAPDGSGACAGFAAAKADGHLYCLVADGARYRIDPKRAIRITRPGAIADAAFDDEDRLWVGSNLFDVGNVYRVDRWQDPAHAEVKRMGALPIGFPEVIAVRGDVVYRMSDTGRAPSLMAKFRCTTKAR